VHQEQHGLLEIRRKFSQHQHYFSKSRELPVTGPHGDRCSEVTGMSQITQAIGVDYIQLCDLLAANGSHADEETGAVMLKIACRLH